MDRRSFVRALKKARDEHLLIQASHLSESGAQMWEVVHPEEAGGFYAVRWDPEAHTYSCPCEAGRRLIPCKHVAICLASCMPAFAAEQMGLDFGPDNTKGSESMAQDTKSIYSRPVARNTPFSLFKTPTGEATMTTKTSKPTGAAAKAQRQSKLTVVHSTEQGQPQQQAPEATVTTEQPTSVTATTELAATPAAATTATSVAPPPAPTAKAPAAKTQKTLAWIIHGAP